MKLIWGSDGNHELYNLSQDPGERENLVAHKEYAETLHGLLELVDILVKEYDLKRQKATPVKKEELDKATLERIKSLGYIQ